MRVVRVIRVIRIIRVIRVMKFIEWSSNGVCRTSSVLLHRRVP